MRARSLAAALFFLAFAILWTFPLVTHLQRDVPGAAAGDNVAFVWNFWWMRRALATGASFFHTDLLFAPFGIDLTLYTHTALTAFIGATLLAPLPVVAAQNMVVLASMTLNGVAAYLLAFDRTRDWGASMIGGLLFAGSPYIAGHLMGHFNLISAWGLPLFLLFLLRVLDGSDRPPRLSVRDARVSALGAGLCAVAIAYSDYYYLVYAVVTAAALVFFRFVPLRLSVCRTALLPRARVALAALFALDGALVAAIVASGGFTLHVGALTISANRATNALSAAWILVAVFVLLRYRPRVHRGAGALAGDRLRPLSLTAAIAAVGVLPLAWRGASLWMRGDYVAPRPTFRSGAGGVDVATVILGNPWHPVWGPLVTGWYGRLGINPIESSAWLGLVPIVLLCVAVVRFRDDPEVRRWMTIGGVFGIWALGPWFTVAGFNTGLMLPENLFQFVPVLANARIPGRAMVLVFLALAMIAAVALARIGRGRPPLLVPAIALLIGIDFLPSPLPLTHLEVPGVYFRLLALDAAGAVCDLPTGVHDGFGEYGAFDNRTLFYQTLHGRPLVGGSTSRMPRSIQDGYRALPIVRSLFRLSEGLPVDAGDETLTRADARAALSRAGIGYLVLDRVRASAALTSYVESALPLELIANEGERELFAVQKEAISEK